MQIPPKAWHKCEARGCNRRVRAQYCVCGAHRSVLGWRANADLQKAWLERTWNAGNHEAYVKALSNAQALIDAGHVATRMQ